MPNIQLKSSIFTSFIILSKILGGPIDPPDPPLTGPLYFNYLCSWTWNNHSVFSLLNPKQGGVFQPSKSLGKNLLLS